MFLNEITAAPRGVSDDGEGRSDPKRFASRQCTLRHQWMVKITSPASGGVFADVPHWRTGARITTLCIARERCRVTLAYMAHRVPMYVSRALAEASASVWLILLSTACASSGIDTPSTNQTWGDAGQPPFASSDDAPQNSSNEPAPGTAASTATTVSQPSTLPHESPAASEPWTSTSPAPTVSADGSSSDDAPASTFPVDSPTSTDESSVADTVDSAPPGQGAMPRIPAISGTCPMFETGTATIGGLAGISLQVGPKKSGSGSLVFYWHGTGSSASEVNTFLPRAVREEILEAGGILVSFDESTGTGGDCSGTSTFSKDDFDIADLIAACAVRDHAIDPRRIYSTGCSAGGLQAGCMGAMRSSYIAAVAPNSGGEVSRQPIEDPTHTPAVMTMHGGSSDVVVVAFSRTSATYDAHMKEAGSFVVNCDHGGGHCRAPSELYSAAWEFMKAHPFGVEPSPFESGLPNSFPDYCKIY